MTIIDGTKENSKSKYYPYQCKKCGMCCKRVDLIDVMKKYDRGDGICVYLNEDNKCKIYKKRPNLCNGKYVYEKFYSHMTVEEYHKMIAEYCKVIRGEEIERLYQNKQGN